MTMEWRHWLVFLACGAIVIGCNSGSPTAGIDRGGLPVVAQGPITGFGSIIVNGVAYELDDAQINGNGELIVEADLSVGQIVTVEGTIRSDGTTGTANSVDFEANVQGPVNSIDVLNGRLVVMGQEVLTDSGTVLNLGADPSTLDSIAVDDFLQISGFVAAEDSILASFIERRSDLSDLRVIGTVDDLNAGLFRFNVNDLVVDYSAVMVINGFPSGAPAEGDIVLVRGSTLSAGGELLAEELHFRQRGIEGEEGDEAEVEGLITRFVSPTDFDVSGISVSTTSSTVYEGGVEADLMLNVKVQAEGEINQSGIVIADKIEVKDSG